MDPISETIGNFGKYQATRIAMVFFVAIPGIGHIFASVFGMAKTDFWCDDSHGLMDDRGSSDNVSQCSVVKFDGDNATIDEACDSFRFDHSFWRNTIIMEYGLVCQYSYLTGGDL